MKERMARIPEAKGHYPYITRNLIKLFREGKLPNVTSVLVEPEYGYTTRITYVDGGVRITYGNNLGLNVGTATDLAKDKGHTKFMLRAIGINCPNGQEFLLPWWADAIRESQERDGNSNLRVADMADSYLQSGFGYPAYIKPVDGSKGADVFKVFSPSDLRRVLEIYGERRIRVAVVEEPINMPDYRIVILDGELISAYQRIPLAVVGDGSMTIRDLLLATQQRFINEGRDTRINPNDPQIIEHLSNLEKTLDDILPAGSFLTVLPLSNLSKGGTSKDVTQTINKHWVDMASTIASNFGLRLCGVDLACADISDPKSDYSVIEVNASPGLDHYASSGPKQQELVKQLYAKVLNISPNST